jgi:hypothetical protein
MGKPGVILRRNASGSSICSYIHTFLRMIDDADKLGLSAVVDMGNQPAIYYQHETGNQWDWHMEQPWDDVDAHEVWLWDDKRWPGGDVGDFDLFFNAQTPEKISELRGIIPKWLRIKPHIRSWMDDCFAWYGLIPSQTVAVSVRGTDKSSDGGGIKIPPIENYFPILDRYAADGWRLWIQPEQGQHADMFHLRYPSAVIMSEFAQTGCDSMMIDRTSPKNGWQKAHDAIAMLYGFSRCSVLVKNSSNLGDLAAGLGTGLVEFIR